MPGIDSAKFECCDTQVCRIFLVGFFHVVVWFDTVRLIQCAFMQIRFCPSSGGFGAQEDSAQQSTIYKLHLTTGTQVARTCHERS